MVARSPDSGCSSELDAAAVDCPTHQRDRRRDAASLAGLGLLPMVARLRDAARWETIALIVFAVLAGVIVSESGGLLLVVSLTP